jgi:hypothetical protein
VQKLAFTLIISILSLGLKAQTIATDSISGRYVVAKFYKWGRLKYERLTDTTKTTKIVKGYTSYTDENLEFRNLVKDIDRVKNTVYIFYNGHIKASFTSGHHTTYDFGYTLKANNTFKTEKNIRKSDKGRIVKKNGNTYLIVRIPWRFARLELVRKKMFPKKKIAGNREPGTGNYLSNNTPPNFLASLPVLVL